jgi:tetratricopeptide (TPR) repeat protein
VFEIKLSDSYHNDFPTQFSKPQRHDPCQNLGAKMQYDPTSDEDELWNEFNNGATPMNRKVEILYNLGQRELWKYKDKNPLKYWLPALEISRECGLTREWVELCEVITREYITNQDDYEKALEMADEGLGLIPEFSLDNDERSSQAHLTWGKAVAYDNLGKEEKSLTHYKVAAQMYADVDNHYLANIILGSAIHQHIEMEEWTEAEELLTANRAYFQGKEDLARIAYCDLLKVMIMIHREEFQEALALALEVKSVEKQIGELDSGTLRWVAKAYFYAKDYDKAIEHYRQAIKMASKKPQKHSKEIVKSNLGLAEVYETQGKTKEAAAARFDAEAIDSRLKKPQLDESSKLLQEVEKLRQDGDFDLALQLATEIIQDSSESGDISLRLRGECERIFTLFQKEDYEGVVSTWEAMPRATLEFHDELVIKTKNMVCHSLAKLGRGLEAADLINQVFSDARLSQNKQEQAYAYENKVEIESDPEEKSKLLSFAIETNLEAQNIERALKITRKFRDKY